MAAHINRDTVVDCTMRCSPLLRLPAEIRHNIYKMVFRTEPLTVTYKRLIYHWSIPFLLSCRQIYNEAKDLFWTHILVRVEGGNAVECLLHDKSFKHKIVNLSVKRLQADHLAIMLLFETECNRDGESGGEAMKLLREMIALRYVTIDADYFGLCDSSGSTLSILRTQFGEDVVVEEGDLD